MANEIIHAERVVRLKDAASGLDGVIVIHSDALGPAAGGCRFWRYADEDAMIADALRLARGMSYKNAMADLPLGGGKAVLQMPGGPFDRDALFRAFGRAVADLDGAYVTAEDVGTTIADMETVARETRHVAGLSARPGIAGGDPSPWTAKGVFEAMRAAARFAHDAELSDLTVAVQGAGNVGAGLCALLAEAGARVLVADISRERCEMVAARTGATIVSPDEIVNVQADVFAPCALGGVLDAAAIAGLRARLVCGGANNQLADGGAEALMLDRGIAYVPDYVANAGGIINVSAEYLGETSEQVADRVGRIASRVRDILERAAHDGISPATVADSLARARIGEAVPATA
ncbi:leucine dehydrogenase [Novosphingobium chloroacetimidivorans]|uniref:Leucine dehydrogenase n=1 Tax=Novosphingobium chloroacetimidivorans TaxID=1428314 RepID=A0A7W7K8K4_9SPHN|nr:Glu/Leu/Phe/Val dehydrogenase [Novosphingobium chloroacetimidivorans]MBB4857970.1 leucine dehydrogenase [Novosphingobium chloroacetimidivorans]